MLVRSALLATLAALLSACTSDPSACTTCSLDGGRADPPDVYGGGCDANKPASLGGCDVTDTSGVFVDGSRATAGDGSRANPFKSIQAAMDAVKSSKKNVFVCGGTYDEALALTGGSTDGVVLHGGFSCVTWAHDGTRTVLAPSKQGLVFRTDGVPAALEDLELDARDGVTPGESSVVALANGASALTFRRCVLHAGKGVAGAPGSSDPTDPGTAAAGNDGQGTQGAAKVCACGQLTSTGGQGAAWNIPASAGAPSIASAAPSAGAAGSGLNCAFGGAGTDGAAAAAGASGAPASSLGIPSAKGWTPAGGADGADATPSQGGGGAGSSPGYFGGSGGCGGCGGHKGGGGGGGGGSVGVIALHALVRLPGTTVLTSSGGDAGAGGTGQKGQLGGAGGKGTATATCNGGKGGDGSKGGDGGGGAGGVSLGVAWVGTAPDTAGSTFTLGGCGKGASGGIDGVAANERSF